ncbi:hypothetical protein AB0436_04350 [Streptomyces sp. NPDC051322]|uniref:hypothetical protein n=1 Tax=Streptomyces sp. NPDC051322 TaxID=3154645 RepID=UPI00344E5200
MTVSQPTEAAAFARFLRDLTAALDPGGGWCGVFWRRDPDGMRACLDGSEVPPWDVVDALLQDYAGLRGPEAGRTAAVRAGELYAASVAAHDRRPGGREAVRDRLELMLREQTYAAGRERELAHRLRVADGAEARRLGDELAWARDDGRRATARCAELQARLAAPADTGWDAGHGAGSGGVPAVAGPGAAAGAGAITSPAGPVEGATAGGAAAVAGEPPLRRGSAARRRPRGARFAGLDDADGASAAPALPLPPTGPVAVPRGARFGGAPRETEPEPEGSPVRQPGDDPATRRAVAEVVGRLLRLRADGRSGEAHALLCQAALLPAGHLPVLATELAAAGLAADWATLLWEAASLAPDRLAEAVDVLLSAGRGHDCGRLVRQSAARPVADVAAIVLALGAIGRAGESQALLGAFVRTHPPEESARIAESDPRALVPQLLSAAAAASPPHERDLLRVLRVTGLTK